MDNSLSQSLHFESIKSEFLTKVDETSKKALYKYLQSYVKHPEENKETQVNSLSLLLIFC